MLQKRHHSNRIGFFLLVTALLAMLILTICLPNTIIPAVLRSGISGLSSSDYSGCRAFVTPEDSSVLEVAAKLDTIEDAYQVANEWTYVSETRLNGTADKWLTPKEFLSGTPEQDGNPLPGHPVSDCEEQANTLASLIRALGTSADEVRVVLGEIPSAEINKGHVWVEVYVDGKWLALDPSQGPRWDDDTEALLHNAGVPFSFYADHDYPVPDVTAYYNDEYYLDIRTGRGNAPDSWQD